MSRSQNHKVLVLGGRGLVGSALVRNLTEKSYKNILAPIRQELDLQDSSATMNYFKMHEPQWVIMAAAKVGGIHANNTYRADFIMKNLSMQSHVFEAAFQTNVEKFLFLGSSCIYPKMSAQPIKEESLLTGPLEPTNEPYAIAKIAGLKTAENIRRQYGRNFFSAMPTNLYGINDNFHPENSHVIPGLIARLQQAIDANEKEFKIWGSGKPRREFLYVDDLAEACVFLMESDQELPYWINIGTGEDIPISDLAHNIAQIMGFQGKLSYDSSKPDGMMEKRLDVSRIFSLGWKPKINMLEGLKRSIEFYRKNYKK